MQTKREAQQAPAAPREQEAAPRMATTNDIDFSAILDTDCLLEMCDAVAEPTRGIFPVGWKG